MNHRRLTFLSSLLTFTIATFSATLAFADDGTEKHNCEQQLPIYRTNKAPAPQSKGVVTQDVTVFCGSKEAQSTLASDKTALPRADSDEKGFDYDKFIEAISKLLGSVAWPISAVLIAYFFRAELRQLLERLESFKYKDAEAKFIRQLDEAEQAAEPVRQKIPEEWEKATARAMFTQYEQLRRIAEISPRAAILEAWIDVEVAIYAAAEKAGLEVKGQSNPYSLARNLVSLGKIPKDILPFFEKLRRLRNDAAHLPDFVLEESEANKYLDLALGLANTFREYAVEGDG